MVLHACLILVNIIHAFYNLSFFIYIIRLDSSVYLNVLIYGFVVLLAGYLFQLMSVILFLALIIFSNAYALSLSQIVMEYYYHVVWIFIVLEVLLFVAYFWYLFHHYSYSNMPISVVFISNNLYYIGGILLSVLSIIIVKEILVIFIVLTFLEYYNILSIVYLNDSNIILINLTIVVLHLLHILLGLIYFLLLSFYWDNMDINRIHYLHKLNSA